MRGDDVALLHRELMLIGYTKTLHPEERGDSVFGPSTFKAVSHSSKSAGWRSPAWSTPGRRAINAVVEAETIAVDG